MDVVVVKEGNNIKIIENENVIENSINKCYIFGNIYNLDTIDGYDNSIDKEENLINMFLKYNTKLFEMLHGEYSIILVVNNKIYLIRDKMGSHFLYYAKFNNTFIASNSLFYIMKNYKNDLTIDRNNFACYIAYNYVQAPKTIFENVYKLYQGTYLEYSNNTFKTRKYYSSIKHFKKVKNKIKDESEAIDIIEQNLLDAIKLRIGDNKKIGICFSAGIDSTLIASLAKKIPEKEINTFTIGFYDEEKNEAKRAKKIAEYLDTIHHENYINENKVKEIIHKIPDIYSEPFSDTSILPIVYLNEILTNKMDVILTGDGADQILTCFYDKINSNFIYRLKQNYKRIRYKKEYLNPYCARYYETIKLTGIKPQIYYNIHGISFNKHIRYMLHEVNTFLANRLFYKVSNAGNYFSNNLAHPFIDDVMVDNCFKLKYELKYKNNKTKYVLRKILNKYVPEDYLNKNKNGFGIPVKSWLKDYLIDDIIFYTKEDIINKQNLFNYEYLQSLITKTKNNQLTGREQYLLFSYLVFQLWYQKNIKDLW